MFPPFSVFAGWHQVRGTKPRRGMIDSGRTINREHPAMRISIGRCELVDKVDTRASRGEPEVVAGTRVRCLRPVQWAGGWVDWCSGKCWRWDGVRTRSDSVQTHRTVALWWANATGNGKRCAGNWATRRRPPSAMVDRRQWAPCTAAVAVPEAFVMTEQRITHMGRTRVARVGAQWGRRERKCAMHPSPPSHHPPTPIRPQLANRRHYSEHIPGEMTPSSPLTVQSFPTFHPRDSFPNCSLNSLGVCRKAA